MDEMNIPSIILLALIVIALVLVIIHIIRNGGCSGDCSACKSCNNCNNCSNCKKDRKGNIIILKQPFEAVLFFENLCLLKADLGVKYTLGFILNM